MHRSGQIGQRLARVLAGGRTANDLRAFLAEQTVQELVDLVLRLHTSRVADRLRTLSDHPRPGEPLGVATPTVMPSGAVGNLLAGTRQETTLIDVRTPVSLTDLDRMAAWLWQLLDQAWSNTDDLHHTGHVWFYLGRHCVLLT